MTKETTFCQKNKGEPILINRPYGCSHCGFPVQTEPDGYCHICTRRVVTDDYDYG